MNLIDKIRAERPDEPSIFLYMEGMFWKAYEQSAMRFTKEIKAYRLQKRFFKNVNSEVVSMGFPDGSLEEVLKGYEFVRINDKLITVRVNTVYTNEEFNAWKSELLLETEAVAVPGTALQTRSEILYSEAERQVLSQLAAFRVETASPLQCMMLVSDLQALLKQ